MARASWLCLVTVFALTTIPQSAAAHRCDDVQAAIDAMVSAATPAPVLLRLGPHFSRDALSGLLALGQDGPFRRRLAAFGAFGLARHADGLRRIAGTSPPGDAEGRLAYSLATLALGADTDTGTVAQTIDSALVDRRRGVMWVLSRMRHARPRRLMAIALDDVDAEVRLLAAEALIRDERKKARSVLSALVDSKNDAVSRRAVEALIAIQHDFPRETLRKLDPDVAARAYARSHARGLRLSKLKKEVVQRDPGIRAGVLAIVAGHAQADPVWLGRHCRRWTQRYGPVGTGEIAMAGALLGKPDAQDRLPRLKADSRIGAARVFAAFAATPLAQTQIDASTAERVAFGIEAWWPSLSIAERARLLRSLGRIDAPTSVRFVRRVLDSVEGEALVAAAEVLGEHGSVDDAAALVAAADGPSKVEYGPTLAAAAQLCRLEGQ